MQFIGIRRYWHFALLFTIITLVVLFTTTHLAFSADHIKLVVNVREDQHPISPEIYGMNFADEELANTVGVTINRWGGNATTRYNWLLDVANRGDDYFFENIPNDDPGTLPNGSTSDRFVEQNRRTQTETLLTIPMIGWTPKSRNIDCGFSTARYGRQDLKDEWRDHCGNGLRDGVPITGNDPTDTSVAIDETYVEAWLEHLTARYGDAANGGVRFYNLDNEPMLWNKTHRDVHPEPVGYAELRDLTIQYASALKSADPHALTLGPVSWGWTAYYFSAIDAASEDWLNPPDRLEHDNLPLVEWYLKEMATYEAENGVRLLDYLDLHFYLQSYGVALAEAGDRDTQELRLRSTRSLWDRTYQDESWIAEPVYLIPRMRQWVDRLYPGTKLAISEYNFGGLEHINGAVTQADVLGIFGREQLDLATLWEPPTVEQPGAFAFRIYRNYDGAGGTFGDISLLAESSQQADVSVYAARRSTDNATTIMVINKTWETTAIDLDLQGFDTIENVQQYQYSEIDLQHILQLPAVTIENGSLESKLPPHSITLFVVPASDFLPTATPTAAPSATSTATAIPSPTASATPQPATTPSPVPTIDLGSNHLVLPIENVTASSFETDTPPRQSADNNFKTYWSAKGRGEWIQYDLGASETVDFVEIAFHDGATQSANFDIEFSADGEKWTPVYRGKSSGNTAHHELFDIEDSATQFVRIVGYGNSADEWNTVAEVRICTTEGASDNTADTVDSHQHWLPELTAQTLYTTALAGLVSLALVGIVTKRTV